MHAKFSVKVDENAVKVKHNQAYFFPPINPNQVDRTFGNIQ